MAHRYKSSAQRSRSPSESEEEVIESNEELPNSEHEEDHEVSFHPHHVLQTPPNPAGQPPVSAGMYMPYIKGPCMDWTVNDNLYHRFLKWHRQCKNILECEPAALPEHQQCKKVIAWSGDCSMGQYVSWNLPSNELTLDAIWGKNMKNIANHSQTKFQPGSIYSRVSVKATAVYTNGTMLYRHR